ncbi:hypothetical protein EWM64_g6353 [Hericium alpestre]|uniref:Uncharacterized protein n=1 Tax=Hericium alpestre TaxID=135208 RepID=A0A4Y9ZVW5_9AGAM|nr:hypothetical protein EWM64_g6353 [Hericium alpestre]
MSIALPTYNSAIDCYPAPPSSPPTSKDVSDAVIYAYKAEAKFDKGEISEATFVDVLEYQYKIVSASAKHDAFWRDVEHLIEMRYAGMAQRVATLAARVGKVTGKSESIPVRR